MPTCSGGAFPQIQAALASHSPALQGLHCVRSWLPAGAGGQASSWSTAAPCPRAACSTGAAVPPPPPATMHEERLPVVTNPAESRRRLRCRQSPREIVPRASPRIPAATGNGDQGFPAKSPASPPWLAMLCRGSGSAWVGWKVTFGHGPVQIHLQRGAQLPPRDGFGGHSAPCQEGRHGTCGCRRGEGSWSQQGPEQG